MRQYFAMATRVLLLAAALFAAQVVAGALAAFVPQPPIAPAAGTSPLSMSQALALVFAGWALLVAFLARHVSGAYWQRARFLFIFIFLVNCALSAVEAAFFLSVVHLQAMNVVGMVINGLAFAALAALCAAKLVPFDETAASQPLPRSSRPAWSVIVFYLLAYSLAGYFIAWQSPAVRDFYQQGKQIPLAWMPLLQLLRATVWLWLVLQCVRCLRGRRWAVAALVGLAFAGLMGLGLLLPSLFPWPVRLAHLIEIGTSNFLFGATAFLWLTAHQGPDGQAMVHS
jgi:hypothetical protein